MNLGGKKRPQGTRHAGFVVSDLSSVGAGSLEGWIQNPSLLMAMSDRLFAFAKGAYSLIVGWEGPAAEDEGSAPPPVEIRLPMGSSSKSSQEPLHVQFTAIQWLSFHKYSFLALGTSQGSILFYSTAGSLLHRQVFQDTPVLQLRARGNWDKSSQRSSVEELCVVYAKAIVRIDTIDLQPLLHRCLQNAESRAYKGLSEDVFDDKNRIAHQVWNVSRNLGGTSSCIDGAITGVMPPPLLEHQSTQRYFCAITVGSDCALAAHRLSEDRTSSLVNFLIKKIMPATVSTVSALAKFVWRSSDNQEAPEYRPPEVKPQEFGRASLITTLKDRPRHGEKIALSPSGGMAAITDSLGRILLVDTQALVVIRLWKVCFYLLLSLRPTMSLKRGSTSQGYRDAECFFIEVPVTGNPSVGTPSHKGITKQDLVLCLAIHAPRREVVEASFLFASSLALLL
ncbi:hypothetical protein KP509_10G037300 [Ceratopteris richardii]|uniref:Rab3-GAP regulatory subunit N-terminal domain-containing protein n=1 Tax=Ceratopteris richardii TaxID=49495 RepID=A0A8T2TYB9_CERRI|nr:hypothetical protein KP509_10G037300 [Ceratopteris richardii]